MIKEGSTVRLVYTGTLDDGTVFGYAKPEAPMEFQTGMDLTIDGFEREISQMEAGEKKTFTLGIYDAYGEYLDHLVEAVPVEYVPLKNVEVGMRVQMTGENGEKIPVTIKDIAARTGVSINTALGRMRYAIINLRRLAEEHNMFIEL